MKKTLKLLITVCTIVVLVLALSVNTFAVKENFTYIESVSVSIDAPQTGKALDFTASTEGANPNYSVTNVVWCADSGSNYWQVEEGHKAAPGNSYTVIITVEGYKGAASQYWFKDYCTGSINGSSASFSISGDTHIAMVSTDFPMCTGTVSSVSASVTAPVAGAKPSFTAISGEGYYSDNGGNSPAVYKNGIMWYDNTASTSLKPGTTAVFEDGHSYTATIVLVSDTGYSFASSVSGASERVSDSCVIVYKTFELKHIHSESSWKYDDEYHWTKCTSCGSVVVENAHADTDDDNKCDYCGYKMTDESSSSSSNSSSASQSASASQSSSQKPEANASKPSEPVKTETGEKEESDVILFEEGDDTPTGGHKTGLGGILIIILLAGLFYVAVWTIAIVAIIKNQLRKRGK